MTYQLTIIENATYLHIIVTGQNTKDNVVQYLKEVLKECMNRKYNKVLIEERLEGPRLTAFPVFEIASEGSTDASGKFNAIAYVDVNAEGNLMQFAETVAVNRGLPVRVFANVDDAKQWLDKSSSS